MTKNGSAQPPAGGGGAGLRLNWPAVSAVAGAVAAVVALIAYLAPPAPPPQSQRDVVVPTPVPESSSPDTATTRPAPPSPSPSPEPSTPDSSTPEPRTPESRTPEPPMPRSTPPAPASSEPLAQVRPGGCDEAAAALTAYRRNAGTVRNSQAAAAQQARQDLMGASLEAQGVVAAKISRLAAGFQELSFRLTGMTGGDPNQVIAAIKSDVAELNRLCGSG
ncbi:hypothetical protein HTZ77_15485 [Nonomuraea sp. SMC257]|uniref:Uncharacterized protein n=1 Tax=Nonomuraea montanisoli TaxID=2741721 RepID=A0A7Y6M3U8_9ACTN|nr:hypothetical protein [Nonomuraea montanisoli]NUW32825.1 hypothetical protein [Nonomuraea montanisoli]